MRDGGRAKIAREAREDMVKEVRWGREGRWWRKGDKQTAPGKEGGGRRWSYEAEALS